MKALTTVSPSVRVMVVLSFPATTAKLKIKENNKKECLIVMISVKQKAKKRMEYPLKF
jgi:hypothetical protein